uniref:Methyltransferase domain-containing protein n=1 Tax=Chromera velia CCMP2878 TaxID=1169474 RepID=A0A0G4G2N7_9ALVE|eukprot:Cvel_19830.t1-p1 / transcript=Cvel_19830.t1 / gene=Cvel_19830 / organism=Chromera_velia_CCMP2878 / gene_product=Methyltransferase-like protein 13, putative / transcript_product=Methyltransferase-like protein 13, putative / location=Cvel_scaffold1736:5188-9004(+) / protein_length=255 / sequence_SO=supercontig / SO=protein_coding / is_pseudo=false
MGFDMQQKSTDERQQRARTKYRSLTGPFEWYLSFKDLKPVLEKLLPPDRDHSEILVLGSGNSPFSEDLYAAGYTNITNIDSSEEIVRQMRQKCHELTEMDWLQGDASRLLFPAECFDVVIDKACTDAMLLKTSGPEDVAYTVATVNMLLKANGLYISLSHSPPPQRLPFLTANFLDWKIEAMKVPKHALPHKNEPPESLFYYLYVCRRPDAPMTTRAAVRRSILARNSAALAPAEMKKLASAYKLWDESEEEEDD